MNIQSIFQKISNATNPARFVESGNRDARVWVSAERIVIEEFSHSVDSGNQNQTFSREAIARDVGKHSGSDEISLRVSQLRIGITEHWAVLMRQGDRVLVEHEGTSTQMITLYKKLYASLTSRTPGGMSRLARLSIWGSVGVVVLYAGFAILGGLVSATGGAQKTAAWAPNPSQYASQYASAPNMQMPPMVPSGLTAPQADAKPQGDYMLSEDEKKLIAKQAVTISLSNSGNQLLAFSDPHCPYCRQLESSLESVAKAGQIKPTIIPVAFKDGSRELVAAVLCSKDPAEAWKKTLQTGKSAGAVCDAGLKKVDQNNKLFADLHLSATPTLLSPKGLILATAAAPQELEMLMKH